MEPCDSELIAHMATAARQDRHLSGKHDCKRCFTVSLQSTDSLVLVFIRGRRWSKHPCGAMFDSVPPVLYHIF
jgi:hypothetical protein